MQYRRKNVLNVFCFRSAILPVTYPFIFYKIYKKSQIISGIETCSLPNRTSTGSQPRWCYFNPIPYRWFKSNFQDPLYFRPNRKFRILLGEYYFHFFLCSGSLGSFLPLGLHLGISCWFNKNRTLLG